MFTGRRNGSELRGTHKHTKHQRASERASERIGNRRQGRFIYCCTCREHTHAAAGRSRRTHVCAQPEREREERETMTTRQAEPYDHLFKLLLVGDAAVGKSRWVYVCTGYGLSGGG